MSSIMSTGIVIPKIAFETLEFQEKTNTLCMVTMVTRTNGWPCAKC